MGMQPFDYRGVYVFAENGSSAGHLATLCNADFHKRYPNMSIEAENIAPIFADTEADYYPACEECGGVFDYINLTREGEEQMVEMRDEELAMLAEMNTGQLIRYFVSELHEKGWLFGQDVADLAYGQARNGRLDEAIETLKGR